MHKRASRLRAPARQDVPHVGKLANLNAVREETGEKEEQCIRPQGEYRVFMAECRKRIEWIDRLIMFQDNCHYLTVCTTLMTHSKVSPPARFFDCF